MQTNINKPDSDKDVLLKMVDIEKSFPGVKALDHAQLTVRRGTVHALMGENGAGKSTLMKCLFGVYSKDGGHIYVDGQEVNYKNSKEALENGVAMVHQELNQALKRNVMDNMWLGRFPTVSKFLPFTSEKKMYDETARIFKELEINVDPKTIMSTMPVSQRQMVEIAKAVSYNSKIIVFDEPTSSLTEEEAEHLFRIINMLRDRGCAIIYISHKMEEILRISDEVTIMCDGRWVATKPASELTMNEIIRLMVGRELTNRYPKKDNEIGDVLLKVENLGSEYTNLRDVSFEANRGEILGVAGLDGSGRTELLEQIFGITTRRSGKIFLDGKEVKKQNSSRVDQKRICASDRRTARDGNLRHSQHQRECDCCKPEEVYDGSVRQQEENEGNYRQVHKLPENKDSQPGDEDKLSFGRQSAEDHFCKVASDRPHGAPARRAHKRY